jgi:hypothetical protein
MKKFQALILYYIKRKIRKSNVLTEELNETGADISRGFLKGKKLLRPYKI